MFSSDYVYLIALLAVADLQAAGDCCRGGRSEHPWPGCGNGFCKFGGVTHSTPFRACSGFCTGYSAVVLRTVLRK